MGKLVQLKNIRQVEIRLNNLPYEPLRTYLSVSLTYGSDVPFPESHGDMSTQSEYPFNRRFFTAVRIGRIPVDKDRERTEVKKPYRIAVLKRVPVLRSTLLTMRSAIGRTKHRVYRPKL